MNPDNHDNSATSNTPPLSAPPNFRASKRSSISFGSYHRLHQNPSNNFIWGNTPYGNSSTYQQQQKQQQQQQQLYNIFNNNNITTAWANNSAFNPNTGYYYSCSHRSNFPIYALDWTVATDLGDLVCLGSYKEDNFNKIQILSNTNNNDSAGTTGLPSWETIGEFNGLNYPISRVQWSPLLAPMFATCSENLRLWSFTSDPLLSTGEETADTIDYDKDDFVASPRTSINPKKQKKNNQQHVDDSSSIKEVLNLSLCKHLKSHHHHHSHVNDPIKPLSSNASALLLGSFPPVTSFDWNKLNASNIISCSIDTTCTVWDINLQTVKTQLIAHDSEVFDVKYLHGSTDLFATCGEDGSVRVFDLRALDHSSIIYEPILPSDNNTTTTSRVDATSDNSSVAENTISINSLLSQSPTSAMPGNSHPSNNNNNNNNNKNTKSTSLLRLETSPFDFNIIATIMQDSNKILLLDMRYPGTPVAIMNAHVSTVNSIKWHPTRKNILASCSDDCQVLIWDTNRSSVTAANTATTTKNAMNNGVDAGTTGSETVIPPSLCYNDSLNEEINNLSWRGSSGSTNSNTGGKNDDWLGLVRGKYFQSVKC
ncbi:uncharacterized protein SCODWIG_00228 [Saccharomycodes ludwigii]|uniref:WD repeat-containing protein YPL247C n=1 Tax=Saccharomycodes ludwigii TaxID=36035 RepID=A0A376B1C1_9ASCO|nr:uncharacterized protein SCODWIG_00228 [Saccharomycodes ludwigii]